MACGLCPRNERNRCTFEGTDLALLAHLESTFAQCSPFASKIHSKVNFLLICLQMCIFCSTFARFCITLSRSAIEAHRTRSASWKRSMPPLAPLTHEVRGGPVKARRTRSDHSTAREIRTLLAAKEYETQQHQRTAEQNVRT